MKPLPQQALLREWLDYNSASGIFYWRKEPRPARPLLGAVAGTRHKETGYIFIAVRGFQQFGAHRLAWVYTYGDIPPGMEIDHIDGDPSNNAIGNLRLATSSQQKKNKRVQSNNRSGLKGAFFHARHRGKQWRSQIKVDGRLIFLGYFHTAEEAHRAYRAAELKYFGKWARAA